MTKTGSCRIGTLIEAVCSIHLSSYVQSPYRDRGGLMLIGPTGVLKTTVMDMLDNNYHNALSISNAYMEVMKKLQPSFYNNQVRSLCFPDLQSIYAGDPRTANRIEQMMMQLSGEATRTVGGGEDSRYAKFKGYCTIFAAMPPAFYTAHVNKWDDSGFSRRFLWSTYTLADPEILMRAIAKWTRAFLGDTKIPVLPAGSYIPDQLTNVERNEIRTWLNHQPGPHEIQFQVLCKATSALQWHYHQCKIRRSAMHTMREFAETLQHDAALLEFPIQKYDDSETRKVNAQEKNQRPNDRRNGYNQRHNFRQRPKKRTARSKGRSTGKEKTIVRRHR